MRSRHPNRPWSILFVIGLLVMLAASCAPPATPVPPGQPLVMPKPDANCWFPDGSEIDQPREVTTGSHFVLNQVILTGPADQFNQQNDETWQQQLGEVGIRLIPLRSCDLGTLGPDTAEDMVNALSKFAHPDDRPLSQSFQDLPSRESQSIQTHLFQVDIDRDDLTFIEAVPIIAGITSRSSDGERSFVFADPNYLVGPLEDGMPCADPNVTEANPFTVGGSPFTVGGSAGAPTGAVADGGIFWEQWALRDIGVEKPEDKGTPEGIGTLVAVFDTSPFEKSVESPVAIGIITPTLDLNLRFPTLLNSLAPRPAKSQDVRNHGLFAAGLVHAVAPGSDIYLIRVLNEYGCGDLYALATAISSFTRSLEELPADTRPKRIVYNLSLGVPQPSEDELETHEWRKEITLLEEVIRSAFDNDIVVVAAAGNESTPPNPAARMQLPAAYPHVIGVAASTLEQTASCYTNMGDVGAPGANGGPQPASEETTEDRLCAPLATECAANDGDCPWGVVSLSQGSSGIHYQFWVGTSFAAPLVSGQAARLMSQVSSLSTPSSVMQDILGQAVPPPAPQDQLGPGIIHVSASATP